MEDNYPMRSDRLRRLSVMLGRVPSFGWALAYVTCIPVFALLYASLPYSFYHSTVMHEAATERLLTYVSRELEADIKRNFDEVHQATKVDVADESISGGIPVFFSDYDYGEESTFFDFTFNTIDATVHAELGSNQAPDGRWLYRISMVGTSREAQHVTVAFPCRDFYGFIAEGRYKPDTGCLLVRESTQRALSQFLYTRRGFPPRHAGFWDQFLRMLYFSAVTISTLGYGDIVPLTSLTRGLVTLEVVLGPILLGLFLNSLLRETARNS